MMTITKTLNANPTFHTSQMFNFHTYYIDKESCLLNVDVADLQPSYPVQVKLSIGLHPWKVTAAWRKEVDSIREAAQRTDVWAIGECGLDKAKGEALPLQMEAFRAQIAIAEEVEKPMVIHCVRAFDELLMLHRELEMTCKQEGREPQPWVIHGFRGKPEQAKQMMTKGLLISFGHQYNLETLRFVFTSSRPFYLETDDLRLSIRQIYEQVAHHLDVDVSRLVSLCDPLPSLFSRQTP